ncbi:hypothetical protein E3N88_08830 [Mikania micrantha]|uniref:Uncharacterized protein n=1 Tax=Mikania micrantha TaxID=192012 RepID=A0A5N6PHF0_9ASTR|nr:hypothetical protein E3N88_08830 [Mikania micrantha]
MIPGMIGDFWWPQDGVLVVVWPEFCSIRLLHRLTCRVPRREANRGFAYREDFRRNLRYFAFIAYRGGLSSPPPSTATSPIIQHLEIFLRFSIPGNPGLRFARGFLPRSSFLAYYRSVTIIIIKSTWISRTIKCAHIINDVILADLSSHEGFKSSVRNPIVLYGNDFEEVLRVKLE